MIHTVECFDTLSRKTVIFTNEECEFAYRDSLFKHDEVRGRYYVLRVSFKLNPDGKARHLDYGPLRLLEEKLGREPSIREVAEEITEVRKNKLPEPGETGSAGSFFKNPVVSTHFYEKMKEEYPDMPGYPAGEGLTKLSAAWLIDHSGMKGYRIGGI